MGTITRSKAAPVSFSNIVDTGTEGTKVATGTTAQRGTTAGQFRYNSTTGKFEGRDASTFTALEPYPTVTSVDDTEVDSAGGGNQTFVITGTNFSTGDVASFIGNDGTEITAATTTINSATQITAVITKVSFLNSKEPYDVRITSSKGLSGNLTNQINVDNAPTWTTAAGNLGTVSDTATGTHFTLVADDAEGDTVAYTETGGTNITGAGMALDSATGIISGDPTNVVSDTTVSFDVRATAGGKTSDRAFNIIVSRPKLFIGSTGTTFATSGDTATKSTHGYETVTVTGDMSVYVDLWGAGGGGSNTATYETRGGAGGHATGQITLLNGTTYIILVGKAGTKGDAAFTIFPDNGLSHDNGTDVGNGGGSTRFGLYTQSGFNLTNTASDYNNTGAVYQLIAGAGGGGSHHTSPGYGSGTPAAWGGGTNGSAGGAYYSSEGSSSPGGGGSQVAGGTAGTGGRLADGTAGAKYAGGEGTGGAGGGGYYGGGGSSGHYSMGGGGSGFLNTGGGLLTNTAFATASTYYTAPDSSRTNKPSGTGEGGYSGSTVAGTGGDGAVIFTLV